MLLLCAFPAALWRGGIAECWCRAGSGGSGLSFSADVFDPIGERDTADHLRQVVVTIEPSPALLGGFGQLEDHGERGLVRQAALRPHRAMADRRERALDRVRGAQVFPVLG